MKRNLRNLLFKHITLTMLLSVNLNLIAQTIDEVIIPGATSSNSGGTWSVNFFSSTNSTTNANNYKEIKLVQTGTKGSYIVFDATTGSSDWQIVQGQPNGGSWSTFCKPVQENDQACNGTCTTSYYIRNVGTTSGNFSATIKIGLSTATSNKNSSCTYDASTAYTVEANVNKVSSTGIYRWTEPPSGNDSSYSVDVNWTPTRSTPSTDDILIIDLGQTNMRKTTIYMDNVNESIDQFIIYPNNLVTFKCSTSASNGNWTIGKSTSTDGDDFRLDTLSAVRFLGGNSTLKINIPTGNTAMLKSDLNVISGSLEINGPGSVTHRKNIITEGGSLEYKSTSVTNLKLAGKDTKLSGSGGTLYIDSTVNVIIGNGATSNFTLERVLPIISNLTLLDNTTLISNAPSSYTTSADINAWTPYLQLKATERANSSANGQLLTVPSTASITGGAQFEIFNNKQRAYRAFGIPLSNGTMIPQFTDDIDVTGDVTGSNENEFTTTCSFCTHSLYNWDETTGSWSPYSSGNSLTTIPIGTGILTFFRGAKGNGLGDTNTVANSKIIDFKGQLQTGNVSVNIYNNGSGTFAGYNLIGNPYPCTIDLREVYESNKTKILPRFYLYDAITRRYNSWDSVGKNGNAPSIDGATKFKNASNRNRAKLLAAGASAFFIYNAGGTSSTITFSEDHKYEGAKSSTNHFSSGIEEDKSYPCNELRGELRYQNSELPETDGFIIEYNLEGYDESVDKFDMAKLYAGYVGIGTNVNNSWLTIDRRDKVADVGQTNSIPLKVAYPKEGPTAFEIVFNTCKELDQPYEIKLFDKLNNSITEITNESSYSFSADNTNEKKADRFELLFTGKSQSSKNEGITKQILNVFPNPSSDGYFYVLNNFSQKPRTYEVIGIDGRCVTSGKFNTKNDVHSIDLNQIPKGIYVLKLTGEEFIQTEKIQLN